MTVRQLQRWRGKFRSSRLLQPSVPLCDRVPPPDQRTINPCARRSKTYTAIPPEGPRTRRRRGQDEAARARTREGRGCRLSTFRGHCSPTRRRAATSCRSRRTTCSMSSKRATTTGGRSRKKCPATTTDRSASSPRTTSSR